MDSKTQNNSFRARHFGGSMKPPRPSLALWLSSLGESRSLLSRSSVNRTLSFRPLPLFRRKEDCFRHILPPDDAAPPLRSAGIEIGECHLRTRPPVSGPFSRWCVGYSRFDMLVCKSSEVGLNLQNKSNTTRPSVCSVRRTSADTQSAKTNKAKARRKRNEGKLHHRSNCS